MEGIKMKKVDIAIIQAAFTALRCSYKDSKNTKEKITCTLLNNLQCICTVSQLNDIDHYEY